MAAGFPIIRRLNCQLGFGEKLTENKKNLFDELKLKRLSQKLFQRQPCRSVLRKRRSENMQQTQRRTTMPKCDFNKVALQLY